ncbi:hypothetical protein Lal_00033945 [Lupinus albus]|nr:hypothetical protein Lal_00033945 [Lupinus albus]
MDLNTSDAILAQNKILTQQIEALTKQMSKLPQRLHAMQSTPIQQQVVTLRKKEVQYINNPPRQGNFPNNPTYNGQFAQGWRGNQNQNQNYNWRQNQDLQTDNHLISNHSNKSPSTNA